MRGTHLAPSPREVVLGFFEAVNDHRLDDLGHYLGPEVIDHNKIIHGEANEPGAAFDAFRQQLDAFADAEMRPEQMVIEKDHVVTRIMARGTHTGSHPRMPTPTGRRFEVEQVWIFTVNDGKITEIRAVSDRLGMFLQLGWDWPTT